ncbi:ribonuclease H-like domain-containing protein [Tanacetum coccineum]
MRTTEQKRAFCKRVETKEDKTGGGLDGITGNKDGSELERTKSLKHGSGSDTHVPSCSNECKESYANLKRLYDAQREQLSDASVEIKAYTQGLKKVEAQLVAINYGSYFAVPPPMTGNYLPSGPDIEIDDSQYTYGQKVSNRVISDSQTTELLICDSNTSTEPSRNRDIIEFCGLKGIKREYSNARTPQQNGVAERKIKDLIGGCRGPCLQIHFYLTLFGLKQLVLLVMF